MITFNKKLSENFVKIDGEATRLSEASDRQLLMKQVQILQESYKLQRRIKNNVIFWFWLVVLGGVGSFLAFFGTVIMAILLNEPN